MAVAEIDTVQKTKPKQKRVTFGSVTVLVDIPSEAEVERNIKEGQAAMARFFKRLAEGLGVDMEFAPDVPYYHADPDKPFHLIRTLNGKKESGIYKNGKFVVCQ